MEGGTVSNHAETRPPSMLSLPFLGGGGWEDEGKEQGREKLGKGEKGASSQGSAHRSSALARGMQRAVPSSPSLMQEPSRLEAMFPSPPHLVSPDVLRPYKPSALNPDAFFYWVAFRVQFTRAD